MYSNDLTVVVPGWSERSYELLRTFLLGLDSEPEYVAGMPGVLNSRYRVNKVIYRFEGQRNLDTSGMWLFGRNDADHALFFTAGLHLGYGGTGAAYGEMLLYELGVGAATISYITSHIEHVQCEVTFALNDNGEWCATYVIL